MFIKHCPKCGNLPKIRVVSVGNRREPMIRVVGCPRYCSVLHPNCPYDMDPTYSVVFYGSGDDNTLYKLWNERLVSLKEFL